MKAFITGGLVWIIDYFLLALGYFYFTQSLKKERQLRRLQEENQLKINENIALKERELEKEKERFTLEQAYLRSQINPHFLFNMLNFFYAKSFENSPELADAILTLSQMMHYSLGKNENHQGLALLSDEIEHINNMIKLQQIRFSNRLQIRFDIDGNMAGKRIAPMVLVTLVENAFKHGDLLDAKNPVIISLRTDSDKNWLYFETHNKKKKGPKVLSPGIGIKNTKKRLQQLYKENYTLCVVDSEEFFTAILELPFLTDAQIMENMPILQNAL